MPRRSGRVWLALAILAAAASPAHAASPCADAVARQRVTWGAVGMPRVQPPAGDGTTVRHWATSRMGTWIVELTSDRGSRLRRVADGRMTDAVWSAACELSLMDVATPAPSGLRFTDADLRRLADTHPRGLVYVWSPHMPLSVEGVAVARRLAARRQLPLAVLLDPAASTALARSVAAQHGWPEDTTRPADSTELRFRDVLLHAPTLQAYAGGRLAGSALPGHHTDDEYDAYLDRVFDGR